ncbi:MAG TPA: carboxy terminal-processing peptidase [Chthoniobacterales bacterium]
MPKLTMRTPRMQLSSATRTLAIAAVAAVTAVFSVTSPTIADAQAAQSTDTPDNGQVAISVAKLLEQGHYTQQRLDDAMSQKLFDRYLQDLDYANLFFTQQDVDKFRAKYATELDDDIMLGNLNPAYEVYDVYKKRVADRVAWIKQVVNEKFDFKSDRTVAVDRHDLPRPKDLAEADQLWRDRIEGELLGEKLQQPSPDKAAAANKSKPNEKGAAVANETAPVDSPVQTIVRRYNQLLRNVNERDRTDQTEIFLNALATSYDPHSEYMGQSQLDGFNIHMKLSLVGIGAVLRPDDGYAKVAELVPGGPADRDGRIKVGDRISAVGQGKDPLVDTVDMKLDKVVEQIRGKKGTVVRLQILPASDPTKRTIIEIVRDEVQLKEQLAKAEIIDRKNANGQNERLGWITLPSFYADMSKKSKTSRSTTRDVAALIKRLQKEKIDGLVIDLRRDGGGSLEEAVNMTGLFITDGPVVQYQTVNGGKFVLEDRDPDVAYGGPLVVLTNKFSASASEIFTAALQDYGRAVVVGDSTTFGKGTVQTLLNIDDFMPLLSRNEGSGAIKLTIQKFYRVSGGSTQLRGVASNIQLPSLSDTPKVGEVALENPLPYDEIDSKRIDLADNKRPLFLDELKRRSADRIIKDPEFKYILEDIQRVRTQLEENKLSLNEDARRKQTEEDKTRDKARTAAREKRPASTDKVYALTLDDVDKPQLTLAADTKKAAAQAAAAAAGEDGDDSEDTVSKSGVDAIRGEALNILSDLIDLSRTPRTASTAP